MEIRNVVNTIGTKYEYSVIASSTHSNFKYIMLRENKIRYENTTHTSYIHKKKYKLVWITLVIQFYRKGVD